jgi:hypothetical protein
MSSKVKKATKDQQTGTAPADKPAGYQPSVGRKLFMLGLCIVGLIIVWVYYFHIQPTK